MKKWMKDNGYNDISKLIGAAHKWIIQK
jgi:hypothetical protein